MRGVATVLLFGLVLVGAALADEKPAEKSNPLTEEQAADAVLEAVKAKDEAALEALAEKDDPDPWLVADELCHRGEHDAAEAFAGAAQRVDTKALPVYVEVRRTEAADVTTRDALRDFQQALERGDAEAALAVTKRATTARTTVSATRLRHGAGLALRRLDRPIQSAEAYQAAAEAAKELGWWRQASDGYAECCKSARDGSVFPLALSAQEQRLALDQERGDRVGVAWALASIGGTYSLLGEPEKALSFAERALALAREIDDAVSLARALWGMGYIQRRKGRYEMALSCYGRALAIMEEAQDRASMARILRNIGVVYFNQGELDKADSTYQRALALDEALGNRHGVAQCLGCIGMIHAQWGKHALALSFYERAVTLTEELRDRAALAGHLWNEGLSHFQLGDNAQALSCYERALAIAEEQGQRIFVAKLLAKIGRIRSATGSYDEALVHLERLLRIAEEQGERLQATMALDDIGSIHLHRGDYPNALRYFERGLAIREGLGARNQVAVSHHQVGEIHRLLSDYPRALSHFERALAMAQEVGNRSLAAYALGSIGAVHGQLGNYAKSLSYCERHLRLAEELEDRVGAAHALAGLGIAHSRLGEHARALPLLVRAVDMMRKYQVRGGVSSVLRNLAIQYYALGMHAEALARYEKALALAEEAGDRRGAALARGSIAWVYSLMGDHRKAVLYLSRAVREQKRLRMSHHFVWTLAKLARVRLEMGEPARALMRAQQALRELESILGGLAEEESATAREQFARVFAAGTLAAARLDEPEEALTFLESGRAGSLLESLGGRQALLWADLPKALRDAEEVAQADVAHARRELASAGEASDLRVMRKKATALDEALERAREVSARVQREAKRQAGLFYPRAATLEEIQGWLEEGEALVLYALCFDEALALVLTRDDQRIVDLGSTAEVEGACASLEPSRPDWEAAATLAVVRKQLVETLELGEDVKTVLVSPEGPLCYLPFGALFDQPVAVTASGTTHVLLRKEDHGESEGVLALGDPDYAGVSEGSRAIYFKGRKLSSLSATRAEVDAVGTERLLGADANEMAFAAKVGGKERWRAVHFACHGLVDPERPTLSSLALSGSKDGDGFLTALEVLRMEIPADLAVLSACETAKGKVIRGEGIVGLTRAFMYAGAPRVLCSLWKVDDEATRALMVKFYELWNPKDGSKGLGAAAALKEAQAFIQSHEKWKHPYYWAAWVLWGLPD